MFGEKVFLQCLPVHGDHELLIAKAGGTEGHYFALGWRFPRLNEKVFLLERSNLGTGRYQYRTYRFSNFSLIEDGEKALLDGSAVEVVKLYFSDSKDPMKFYIMPPDSADADFRKLETIFREQEYLDGKRRGNVFVKKLANEKKASLEDLTGSPVAFQWETEEEAIQCRGINSLEGFIEVAKEDPDYLDVLKDVKEILIGNSSGNAPEFSLESGILKLGHNESFYNSREIAREWFLENA